MILFKNGLIYSIKEEPFVGNIVVENDKIFSVTKNLPSGNFEKEIELNGRAVIPGFIDAHSHEGMIQGEIGDAGDDINEMSDPITPQLRAIDGINPHDPSLIEGVQSGVTVINTGPGSANVFGGSFAIISPIGHIVDEMIIKSPSAIKLAFGENPKDVYSKNDKEPQTRMAIAALAREWFYKAQDYYEKKKKFEEDPEDDDKKYEFDLKLEALSDALSRKVPVHIHAHRADDIATAIRLSEEFGFELVLIHATEGHKIADYIASKNIPCIVGPSFPGREKAELNEISFETVSILHNAGVKIAIQSDTLPPLKYFHSIVCMAVKYGMSKEDALKAVTLNAAEILHIDNEYGSLEKGKKADIVIFDKKDPLDFYAHVDKCYISGVEVYSRK